MVRTKSPLASLQASGAIGGTVTFRRSPRGTVLLRHFTPHDPKTPAQLGARALMRLLQLAWSKMITSQKALFKPSPDSTNQETYLAFLKRNLLEFHTYHAILTTPPRNTTALTWNTSTQSITAEVHALRLLHDQPGGPPFNMYLIYRRRDGIPDETQSEFVGGTYALSTAELNYLDVVPTLDTYGYRVVRQHPNGQRSPSKTFAATAPLDE